MTSRYQLSTDGLLAYICWFVYTGFYGILPTDYWTFERITNVAGMDRLILNRTIY